MSAPRQASNRRAIFRRAKLSGPISPAAVSIRAPVVGPAIRMVGAVKRETGISVRTAGLAEPAPAAPVRSAPPFEPAAVANPDRPRRCRTRRRLLPCVDERFGAEGGIARRKREQRTKDRAPHRLPHRSHLAHPIMFCALYYAPPESTNSLLAFSRIWKASREGNCSQGNGGSGTPTRACRRAPNSPLTKSGSAGPV